MISEIKNTLHSSGPETNHVPTAGVEIAALKFFPYFNS